MRFQVIEKIILLPDGNIVAASTDNLFLINESFDPISNFGLVSYGAFDDLFLEENSIYLVTKNEANKTFIHELNFQLELINSWDWDIPNSEVVMVRVRDGMIGVGSKLYSKEIENNTEPPFSIFLKVFNKEEEPKFKGTDIKLEKIRVSKSEVEKDSSCNIDLYNVILNVKLTVKNEGPQKVNELYVNFKFDSNVYSGSTCTFSTFQNLTLGNIDISEKFFHLNLPPGESTEIFMSDIPIMRISLDQIEHLGLVPICFSVSSIDHSMDVDPSDNYLCEKIFLSHETLNSELNSESPFVLFPNPTSDRIRARILKDENPFTNIWISNTLGQRVSSPIDFDVDLLIEFDVDHLPNGIYFINFDDGENFYSQKFIKQ